MRKNSIAKRKKDNIFYAHCKKRALALNFPVRGYKPTFLRVLQSCKNPNNDPGRKHDREIVPIDMRFRETRRKTKRKMK